MANIVRVGGGAEEEIYDGYTLFRSMIGKKFRFTFGNEMMVWFQGIDMSRVKSMNYTQARGNGYDRLRIFNCSTAGEAKDSNKIDEIWYGTHTIDFENWITSGKVSNLKTISIQVYGGNGTTLEINSLEKAD